MLAASPSVHDPAEDSDTKGRVAPHRDLRKARATRPRAGASRRIFKPGQTIIYILIKFIFKEITNSNITI